MSPNDQSVLDLLALAEAELAVLKQEHVLRRLVDTGEPTSEELSPILGDGLMDQAAAVWA